MKVRIMFKGDIKWTAGSYDLELMLVRNHMLPSGGVLLTQIRDLQHLGYVMEQNKTIYVLREPMELNGGQVEYNNVEYNIDFIMSSSSLFMVKPVHKVEDVDVPAVDEVVIEQYLEEEEKN